MSAFEGLYGFQCPTAVSLRAKPHKGRVQLSVAGIDVKIPPAIACQLADALVDAAEIIIKEKDWEEENESSN